MTSKDFIWQISKNHDVHRKLRRVRNELPRRDILKRWQEVSHATGDAKILVADSDNEKE